MPKPPKPDLVEAKRIAARMLAMPPQPKTKAKPKAAKSPVSKKGKPAK